MKKAAIIVLVVLMLSFFLAGTLPAKEEFDIQSVKKAVKKNPRYRAGDEIRWFKLLITDNRTNKEKVQVTLPLTVIEMFMNCAGDNDLEIDCDDYDLDFKKLFEELKKNGPMSLIEIKGEDATLKIWFE